MLFLVSVSFKILLIYIFKTKYLTTFQIRSTCHLFYRCVPAAGGLKAVTEAQCQAGMFFDIEKQICEISRKVDNCHQWESKY